MERRLLLAFLITFIILVLMQPLLRKYGPKTPQKAETQQAQQQPTPAPPAKPAAPPAGVAAAAPAAPVPAKQAASEQETVVENDLYRIVFTNRGAQVKSWVLKKYDNDKGQPLELVNSIAAPQFGYPMSLWSYDADLRNKLNDGLYVVDKTGTQRAPVSLSFEYASQGLVVRKTFSFDHSYVVRIDVSVEQNGAPLAAYPMWPAGFGDQTVASSYASAKIAYQSGDKTERLDPKKVSGGATIRQALHWAGPEDQYFAAVFLPGAPEDAAMVTFREQIDIPKNLDKPDPKDMQKVPVVGAAVGHANGPTRERVFVGPKAVDVLDAVHASLTRSERAAVGANAEGPNLGGLVDFGHYFGWIAKPLFLWLKWTNKWVRNWGWSIVALTVIITLATMPLRISSMKSSLKMQKVQPQIKAIQEKYKKFKVSDPRRADMNKEVSEIYKREGINPVGGCIPMLLQMPFLIAFYSMLGVAIELRHAHWLWIRDLSSPDPYHILPILIIVSMYYVQKITPSGGMDPVQQKMMQVMMPVFIGAISWSLSAGLGVYWALSNLIAIVQQMWVNNTEFGREMREHMEKQARKRSGKPPAVVERNPAPKRAKAQAADAGGLWQSIMRRIMPSSDADNGQNRSR